MFISVYHLLSFFRLSSSSSLGTNTMPCHSLKENAISRVMTQPINAFNPSIPQPIDPSSPAKRHHHHLLGALLLPPLRLS